VILFDAATGEELHRWELTIGNHLHFSPDNRFLCISGGGGGAVVDCESGEVIWSRFLDNTVYDPAVEQVLDLYCTNAAETIYWLATEVSCLNYWTMLSTDESTEVIDSQYYGQPSISPNGYIYLAQFDLTEAGSSGEQPTPIRVALLKGSE